MLHLAAVPVDKPVAPRGTEARAAISAVPVGTVVNPTMAVATSLARRSMSLFHRLRFQSPVAAAPWRQICKLKLMKL